MKTTLSLTLFATAALLYAGLGWLAGLLLLVLTFVSTVRQFRRAREAAEPTIRCARGHVVDQFATAKCHVCGAVTESSIWRCGLCGSVAGWSPCPVCSIAIRNPMLP